MHFSSRDYEGRNISYASLNSCCIVQSQVLIRCSKMSIQLNLIMAFIFLDGIGAVFHLLT